METTSPPAPPTRTTLLERLLQTRRLAEAKKKSLTAEDPGFHEGALALQALKDAHQLASSSGGREAALLLYRSVLRLLARASSLRKQPPSPAAAGEDGEDVWSDATVARTLAGGTATELTRSDARRILQQADGEALLATMPDERRAELLPLLRGWSEDLARPLEERIWAYERARWSRALRLAGPALVLGALLLKGAFALFSSPNLALNRPVVVTDPDPTFQVDPKQVVDGDRLNLGFHTRSVAPTSVTIDLGAAKKISRVVVFNRADAYQERATPLLLEISRDGVSFDPIERRIQRFQTWTIKLPPGTKGRFVRLLHESPAFFHLAEVEVY